MWFYCTLWHFAFLWIWKWRKKIEEHALSVMARNGDTYGSFFLELPLSFLVAIWAHKLALFSIEGVSTTQRRRERHCCNFSSLFNSEAAFDSWPYIIQLSIVQIEIQWHCIHFNIPMFHVKINGSPHTRRFVFFPTFPFKYQKWICVHPEKCVPLK